MDNLYNDLFNEITQNLTLLELTNICQSNKHLYHLCNTNDILKNKLNIVREKVNEVLNLLEPKIKVKLLFKPQKFIPFKKLVSGYNKVEDNYYNTRKKNMLFEITITKLILNNKPFYLIDYRYGHYYFSGNDEFLIYDDKELKEFLTNFYYDNLYIN